jgi:hypothetical protein
MVSEINEELDHIEAVFRSWLPEIETNPVLGPPYWRQRIYSLMRANHLTAKQLQRADSLLVALERFNAHRAFPDV